MRSLFIVALAGIGCAAAQPKPLAKVDLDRCQYLGEKVYDPRSPILDVTNTFGPSEITYYHREEKSYRVVSGKLYSCPAS
jgi:hypothetical protein